jgi:hypothetical protein
MSAFDNGGNSKRKNNQEENSLNHAFVWQCQPDLVVPLSLCALDAKKRQNQYPASTTMRKGKGSQLKVRQKSPRISNLLI